MLISRGGILRPKGSLPESLTQAMLVMNSMYGKTIIEPIETDTIIKDTREDFEKYIPYNYNYIDSYPQLIFIHIHQLFRIQYTSF